MNSTRYAIRYSTLPVEEARVMARYLPCCYTCRPVVTPDHGNAVLVEGVDIAGWGMDTYVLPRLASGLYFAREVSAEYAASCAVV